MVTDNSLHGSTQELLVIVSQGQSRSPEKRALEESIAAMSVTLPNTSCLVVPHLYDLGNDSLTLEKLRSWSGPIVLLSWLFDRAAFWVLDRHGVRGQSGEVQLLNPDLVSDDEDDDESVEDRIDEKADERVANIATRPSRSIYSIDLRSSMVVADYEQEFRRILSLEQIDAPKRDVLSLDRFLNPTNTTALARDGSGTLETLNKSDVTLTQLGIVPLRVDEHPTRRWYPVIDYSRCTNCMECIDFCLFGVYGVDRAETILVEQPDNCRKGCPACSRVCPENAIMFPQHKTPAIAGAPIDAGGFKIDLSKLFGAPDRDEDPVAAAARERNEQLILAGRAAVEMPTGVATSKGAQQADISESTVPAKARDALDSLIDELDALDL
jgi:NAD-dependent dihydropyrimidine dehydrogenase PreA subunit